MNDAARPAKLLPVLRALLVIAALQGLAVVVYWQVEQRRSQQAESGFRFERLSAAPALPALELERADGTRVQPASSRPVLLHFWATWCPPCREELPALLELGRDDPELDVVALSLDDDWAVVHEFFGGAIPPEVVRDPSGALRKTYEVGALPDTYLLKPGDGAALRFAGARAWASPQARVVLEGYVSRR
jgi:thiol-disulfide isomerase/thioredoxin